VSMQAATGQSRQVPKFEIICSGETTL
jgi:hypothetical protein